MRDKNNTSNLNVKLTFRQENIKSHDYNNDDYFNDLFGSVYERIQHSGQCSVQHRASSWPCNDLAISWYLQKGNNSTRVTNRFIMEPCRLFLPFDFKQLYFYVFSLFYLVLSFLILTFSLSRSVGVWQTWTTTTGSVAPASTRMSGRWWGRCWSRWWSRTSSPPHCLVWRRCSRWPPAPWWVSIVNTKM